MWQKNWRTEIWPQLDQSWDIIIVGGGITGAGILREATRLGLRVLLVEQRDFAWGTSSRSSKLVHGGLRYLKEGKIRLTRASVLERDRLIEEGPGLIDPLGFLLSIYKGDHPGRWTFKAGLSIYDLLALQWGHQYYSAADFKMLAPHIEQSGLEGGFRYGDAQTDDARLVLRVIREAVAEGGVALNYVTAAEVLKEDGHVVGLRLRDNETGSTCEVRARVVVNATGAWADRLRGYVGASPRIRPLRGSHLLFSAWRLPVAQAVSFLHPIDRRPVFIFPWEGVTIIGTTDVDHEASLDTEPGIDPDEVAYLMAAAESQFPSLGLTLDDVVATFAGVRPVIGTGKADPSQESRDHVVWEDAGLLTVTGGKLTTFRLIALDVLKAIRHHLPETPPLSDNVPMLNRVDADLPALAHLDEIIRRRLSGRYGVDASALASASGPGELTLIPGTQTLWAELRWAARSEAVSHLEDLLLRRVRLGLLLPQGGELLLPQIRAICQPELGWDDARWEAEQAAYLQLWREHYHLPARASIPDWRAMLAEARARHAAAQPSPRRKLIKRSALAAGLLALAAAGMCLFWRRRQVE
ncbi:MAG: glycerol-3-phosphate dehydrogenase/oxidase [Chloroflexi bacterium]|nr:glycerol-3-phosphate dehydrogenase/oxidase [Chloroflexota bacterium]